MKSIRPLTLSSRLSCGKFPVRAGILTAALISTPLVHAADVDWIGTAPGFWTDVANWSTDPNLPASGDNLFFGPPGAVVTGGGTFNIDTDTSPVIRTLNLSDTLTANPQTNWTFAPDVANTVPITLTLNSGINYTAFSNHTIAGGSGLATLSVVLGGTQTWSLAKSQAGVPAGSSFSGLNVSAPITDGENSYGITKSGPRQLTITGNNTFDGGITHKEGVIVFGGATANTNFGTGSFTFANPVGGLNNSLGLNSGISRTIANNFVQDNAAVITGSQYAQISLFGGGSGFRVLTFDGAFSTGPNHAANQSILLGMNAVATGLGEGSFVFNGDFSGYNSPNAQAFRISEGSVVINSAAAVPAGGGYVVVGNTNIASKLILGGPITLGANNPVSIQALGAGANGARNSFGSRNAADTFATVSGTFSVTDVDGGNVFSQTAGATLTLGGNVGGTQNLRVNQPYTFTSANAVNTLEVPVGTVEMTKADGNSFAGGVTVVNGKLLVHNTSFSATGTGQVNVGLASAATSGQTGITAATSRVITGISNSTAAGLQPGQTVTGTNIPAGAIVTSITLGATTSTIVIDKTTTAAGTSTDLAFGALTRNGILGGTGRVGPRGANGVLVNSGSSVNLVDGLTESLEIAFREIPEVPAVIEPPAAAVPAVPASGTAIFASGATFAFELGAPGTNDSVAFTGLAAPSTASVAFNNNLIHFTNLGGLAGGTYTLFTFNVADSYTGTVAIGTGLEAFPGANLVHNATNIQLVIPGGGAGDYASWANDNDIDGEPKDGDFDNDGYDNVVEYALGYNPKASNPGIPLEKVGANYEITFPKGAAAAADASVDYFFQTSTTLATWSGNLAPTFEDGTTVKFTLPGGPGKNFVRLVVVDP